jgi:hypothetical protein
VTDKWTYEKQLGLKNAKRVALDPVKMERSGRPQDGGKVYDWATKGVDGESLPVMVSDDMADSSYDSEDFPIAPLPSGIRVVKLRPRSVTDPDTGEHSYVDEVVITK